MQEWQFCYTVEGLVAPLEGFSYNDILVKGLEPSNIAKIYFRIKSSDDKEKDRIGDDLPKMQSLIEEMQTKVKDLFHKCLVTPIVASSEIGDIHPSDKQYAARHNIIIMKREDIDTLLEMLITNRQSREVIEYIKSLKEEQSSLPLML